MNASLPTDVVKVFFKDASGLVCYAVQTDDPVHAREYVDDLVVKGLRTTCLSVVRVDHANYSH
jgi:hypothetical protein